MPKVKAFSAPHPEDRLSREQYRELRAWLLDNDPDANKMVTWASHEIGAPQSPEQMASQIIWIMLCAGRNAQAERLAGAQIPIIPQCGFHTDHVLIPESRLEDAVRVIEGLIADARKEGP